MDALAAGQHAGGQVEADRVATTLEADEAVGRIGSREGDPRLRVLGHEVGLALIAVGSVARDLEAGNDLLPRHRAIGVHRLVVDGPAVEVGDVQPVVTQVGARVLAPLFQSTWAARSRCRPSRRSSRCLRCCPPRHRLPPASPTPSPSPTPVTQAMASHGRQDGRCYHAGGPPRIGVPAPLVGPAWVNSGGPAASNERM
jgi:hypothetical protein